MARTVHKNKDQVFESSHSTASVLHWDWLLQESSVFVLPNQLSHFTVITFLIIFIYLYLLDIVRCYSVRNKWKLCRNGKVKQRLVYKDIGGHLNNNACNFPSSYHIPYLLLIPFLSMSVNLESNKEQKYWIELIWKFTWGCNRRRVDLTRNWCIVVAVMQISMNHCVIFEVRFAVTKLKRKILKPGFKPVK